MGALGNSIYGSLKEDSNNDLLIYGKEYHLWRNDKYLGTATWTDDENVGEEFIRMAINDTGELVHQVFKATKWKFA